jgi:hypothetical protein
VALNPRFLALLAVVGLLGAGVIGYAFGRAAEDEGLARYLGEVSGQVDAHNEAWEQVTGRYQMVLEECGLDALVRVVRGREISPRDC